MNPTTQSERSKMDKLDSLCKAPYSSIPSGPILTQTRLRILISSATPLPHPHLLSYICRLVFFLSPAYLSPKALIAFHQAFDQFMPSSPQDNLFQEPVRFSPPPVVTSTVLTAAYSSKW